MSQELTEQRSRRQASALVQLRRGRPGPTVYCFHPFGGSVAVYSAMINALGREHPVWGLQAIGLSGASPDGTIAEMADRYSREIAATASSVPLWCVGYSMGGVLALETARRLADRTGVSPGVAVIDADPVYEPPPYRTPWDILVRQVFNVDLAVAELAELPRQEVLERVRGAAVTAGLLPRAFNLDRLSQIHDVCLANERAAAAHRTSSYAHEIHVFRPVPAESAHPVIPLQHVDPWASVAAKVTLYEVPGTHHSLLDPPGAGFIAATLHELMTGAG